MLNLKVEEKQKSIDGFDLGFEALEKAKQYTEKQHYKKALAQIKIAINYFRSCLNKKAHCKESRKALISCWDFYVVNMKSHNEVIENQKVFIKKAMPKMPSLRVAVIDRFVEGEWKKQVNGKYGGPKPANLSWRQFYDSLESSLESLLSLEEKVSWAVQNGHISLLQALLLKENDIDFNTIAESNDIHLLNYVILKNDFNMALFLVENGINVNFIDEKKYSSLHYAIHIGNYDLSKLLIENGAKLNQKNLNGATPLILASQKTQTEIIKYLIDKGADINKLDVFGHSALNYSLFNNDLAVAEYLIENKIDLNLKDHYDRTLLHWACSVGKVYALELLIENGVNINQQDSLGRTALHYASQFNQINCIKMLVKYDAETLIKDNYDETALIVAAFCGHKEATSLLHESSGII